MNVDPCFKGRLARLPGLCSGIKHAKLFYMLNCNKFEFNLIYYNIIKHVTYWQSHNFIKIGFSWLYKVIDMQL